MLGILFLKVFKQCGVYVQINTSYFTPSAEGGRPQGEPGQRVAELAQDGVCVLGIGRLMKGDTEWRWAMGQR